MLRPWHVNIVITRGAGAAVYLQIAHAIIDEVRRGRLAPGDALPGTRDLAKHLGVSRKTIVQAYDQLNTQGWIYSELKRGAFVSNRLPKIDPVTPDDSRITATALAKPETFGFARAPPDLQVLRTDNDILTFDDGSPDTRIAPMLELGRAYRRALTAAGRANRLGYGDPRGTLGLRRAVSTMLNLDRGLSTTSDGVCIVRGSQMGIYLAARVFAGPGDAVAMEQLSYPPAREAFRAAGAEVVAVGLDAHGLRLDELEAACRRRRVKLVYLTPHHQFPTAVRLPPERRLRLLVLAEQFGFSIIEDDYDHEFHFTHQPMLPLASADRWGKVVYIGSMSKILTPSIRVGYVAAAPPIVDRLALEAALIDRQGDPATEAAIAEMIETGEVKRHTRRALKVYGERRRVFAELLQAQLAGQLSFQLPEGGLAIWATVDPQVDLTAVAARAARRGLRFYPGDAFAMDGGAVAGTRLGFARLNPAELAQAVERLAGAFRARTSG
jgi:GntR family transcriptional regulator/MocR family aminotransferase